MNNFTPLKRNCPICNGTRRDCRQNKQNSIVHCRADLSIIPQGWKALGQDKWGFEMYAPASNDEQSSPGWQQRQQERKLQQQRQKEELTQGALSESDRDQAIRRIHRYFGISSKHRDNLRARGLTDAHIDHLPYFSFHPSQEVPPFTPASLPGVRRNRLAVTESGFACPIPNIDGLIIGWQNRFDNTENGKYRWPSGEKSAHLPNGELPIGVYRPDSGVTRRAIGHSEGFLKADLIAQRWGLPTLGAASANFAASPEQWKASLDQLSAELWTRIIYWFADAGSVRNFHVTSQYLKAWEKLTEWGYQVQVIWWGQVAKEIGDADEICQEVRESARLISTDEYLAIARLHGGIKESLGQERQRELLEDANQARTFIHWVTSQVGKRLKRLTNWLKSKEGSGKDATPIPSVSPFQGKLILPGDIPAPEVYGNEGAPLYLYRPGDMELIWQAARFKQGEKRYKAVLDVSLTGTGKSEVAGRQRNENWFLQKSNSKDNTNQKLLYFSQSGQNTTAPALEDWTPLARMHNGLIERPDKLTGGKKPFVERPRPGETPTIPGNCWATTLQHLLAQKNIGHGGSRADEDGDSNPICNLCGERDKCKDSTPSARPSGFKSQMKQALAQPRLKGTLAGFPSDHKFELVAFIDEAEATIQDTRDITASIADIDKEFFRLWQYDKELHDAFSFVQSTLSVYLSEEEPPKYGYDFATIKNWFNERNLDSFEFEWAIRKLEAAANELSDRELAMLRSDQSEDDVNTLVTLNWLIPFCRVMAGSQPGSARIANNQLIVTIRNDRELDLIRSFDFTILLDATAERDEIARILGYQPWEILWVMQVPPNNPYANLRVSQVVGLGKCGKQRRDRTSKRIEATEQAIEDWALGKSPNPTLDALVGGRNAAFSNGVDPEKIAYIRHLKYYNAGELYYFGGNNGERGSNAAQDCQLLVLEGLPRENIGSALARYHTLYGTDCSSDHPDFQAWYNRQIDKRIFQAIGRSRYTRRANQIIPVFIMGDADLSGVTKHYGVPIHQADAFHIAAEAGTPNQVNGWKIFQAIQELRQEGSKVLQRQVSQLTNLAQSTISEFARLVGGWKPLIKISEVLLKGLYNSSDISELPDLTEEERAILEEYIPLFLHISPEEVMEEFGVIIRVYGFESFLRIVNAAPLHIQIRMLVLLMQGLPTACTNDLIAMVGGIP